jgi:hypothetical protein
MCPERDAMGRTKHGLWIVGAAAATFAAVYAIWNVDHDVVEEDHLVEVLQAVFLLLAAIVYGVRARLTTHAERTLLMGACLFCISLAMREVDIDHFGDEMVMSRVEVALRAVLVLVWIAWGFQARHSIEVLWRRRFAVVLSGMGMLIVLGCLLYLSSWPFDKFPRQLGGPMARMFEETLQLLATMMLFLSSLAPPIRVLRSQGTGR